MCRLGHSPEDTQLGRPHWATPYIMLMCSTIIHVHVQYMHTTNNVYTCTCASPIHVHVHVHFKSTYTEHVAGPIHLSTGYWSGFAMACGRSHTPLHRLLEWVCHGLWLLEWVCHGLWQVPYTSPPAIGVGLPWPVAIGDGLWLLEWVCHGLWQVPYTSPPAIGVRLPWPVATVLTQLTRSALNLVCGHDNQQIGRLNGRRAVTHCASYQTVLHNTAPRKPLQQALKVGLSG